MINITEIISKRFPINDDFAVTLDHKHLSLTTFSPRPAIELVWDFFRFFYFLEFIGGLFEREVLELKLRIDNFVGEVILVYFFLVFVEDCKIIKIRMPVKIKWHFVETKLKFSSRRQLSQLFLVNFYLIDLVLSVQFRFKDLLRVEVPPQKHIFAEISLTNWRTVIIASIDVFLLIR